MLMAGSATSPHPHTSPLSSQKPKVIYVMGQGKSGSTILGVALGNCTDIFFAGELCNWLMTEGRPVLGGSERIQFWLDVSKNVDNGSDLFGPEAFKYLERGQAAYRIDRWRARRRLRRRYRQVTENLYRSIASRAGATHVVDTSHLPLRARELQNMEGIDLYLIFLVREVEGIVASHTRHVKRHDTAKRRLRFFTVNGHLWWTYLLSIVVFLRHPPDRRLLLRHEDFIAHPEGVLREVLDFAGSDSEIPDLTSLRTGVALKANRLIRSEVVTLKAQAAAPSRPSRLMRLTQRPWTLILARLRPAATGTATPHHAPASDPS
jgi:hypothetical protein